MIFKSEIHKLKITMTAEQLQLVQNKIKHVIVLMLENRSFDHMLGLADITGKIAGSAPP